METFSMQLLQQNYINFLQQFPLPLQPVISIAVVALIVYVVIKIIQRHFVYLILLVILLPASIPVLKNLGDLIFQFIQFLLHTRA